jgi:nucleotide sugar dehydrogenase
VQGEEGLEELVESLVADGALSATVNTTDAVRSSDGVVVIVPLLLTENCVPDYSTLEAVTDAIGRGLHSGTLVVYETTLAVGDTRNRFQPMLDARSGMRAGAHYYLAFSPERVFMGRIFADLKDYPKIVGGIEPHSTERACEFYRSVLDSEVVPVPNTETAEFVKLAETTYRDVNIALANELARAGVALGVDSVLAFDLANTQPFSHLHAPGAGVGGHCIPVYPRLLMSTAPDLKIPALAREVNDAMPGHVVDIVETALGGLSGRRVAVLGLSYRNDVKEAAMSPTWAVVARLSAAGARVAIRDPWFTSEELGAVAAEIFDGAPVADATIILTKHRAFREEDMTQGGVVVDGRPGGWAPKTAPGQRVYVIGRGWR